jgi:hypothetical protein
MMVLVIRCPTLLEGIWTIWSSCLYVFCYYHILSYSLDSIFFINVYMVLFLFNTVIYVFLLLCLCILICLFVYLHRAGWHSSATLTEVFPCFFLSCNANARIKHAKMGHGPYSSILIQNFCVVLCIVSFMSFCVLFVCKCVLYYCHRVATQLQLT